MSPANRRQFLKRAAALPLIKGLPWAPGSSFFGAHSAAIRSYGEEMPDMLLSYIARNTNSLAAKWDQVRSRIRTAPEVDERNRFVREKITQMLGGFPQRNPLSPVVGGLQERDGYRIENVIFQSRPDFWV